MTIYLVSKKAAIRYFARIRRTGVHRVVKITPRRLAEMIGSADEGERGASGAAPPREKPLESAFFYFHAASLRNASEGDGLVEDIRDLASRFAGRVAVFDPEGVVTDPARLFFAGAVDYLGAEPLRGGVSPDRLDETLSYSGVPIKEEGGDGNLDVSRDLPSLESLRTAEPIRPPRERRSGGDWSTVRAGVEYTFWLLHITLDGARRYAAGSSDAMASQISERFREHVLSEVERFGGRVWIWKRYSGLLLFPFDGERCAPIIPTFRLMMNRIIANTELYKLKTPVSYRLALHLGNVIYRETGRTGKIVSEDMNFVFHLAERFTGPGEMSITDLALSYVPEGLYRYFEPKGTFEGLAVYRMRPLRCAGSA